MLYTDKTQEELVALRDERANTPGKVLFDPGRTIVTTSLRSYLRAKGNYEDDTIPDALVMETAVELVNRHVRGDWGGLCEEDALQNEEALLVDNVRFFSTYEDATHFSGKKIYVITDRCIGNTDYPVTTLLFPEDY